MRLVGAGRWPEIYGRITSHIPYRAFGKECPDVHGRDCSYNPSAFPPSMEVRCRKLGQCRSKCRDAQKRPTILLHFLHCTCDLQGRRKVEQRRSSCRDVQVPRSTGRARAAIRGGQRRNGIRLQAAVGTQVLSPGFIPPTPSQDNKSHRRS